MYRVYVVEDEWLVLQGLKHTIPWGDMNCRIAGEATDGAAGYELVLADPPDILITDIRMPGMDGIQLAEKVAEAYPHVKIVFLTGFDDFTYAQKAIKLGAVDFVLKPTNADELIGVIERITAMLDEEQSARIQQQQLHQRLIWEKPLIVEKMLYDLMMDYAGPVDKEWFVEYALHDFMNQTENGMDGYRIVLLQFDQLTQAGPAKNEEWAMLKDCVKRISTLPLVRIHDSRYAIAVNRIIDRVLLAEALESMRTIVSSQELVMSVSSCCEGMDHIPAAYNQAMSALYQTILLSGEAIVWFEDIDGESEAVEVSPGLLRELTDLVKWGDAASIREKTSEWLAKLLHRHRDGLEARRAFFEGIVSLHSHMLLDTELHGIALASGNMMKPWERVKDPLPVWLDRLNETLIEWHQLFAEQSDPQKRSAFEEIKAYIQANYAEDLTLQSIADHYHMSESYFSRLFKKHVGTSFLEYVTQLRIRHAKGLLANPKLKIYEASLQVGYQDSRYFSQIFRKYTGETPTEFRKRLGIETLPF